MCVDECGIESGFAKGIGYATALAGLVSLTSVIYHSLAHTRPLAGGLRLSLDF